MSMTTAARTTTNEYQATRTVPGTTKRRTDSVTIALQVAPRRHIWMRLEMVSALPWTQAWASSAGLAAVRMPASANMLADRSRNEWAATARSETLAAEQ